jgi:DnaT-like ssDNA binding protein
MVSQLVVGENTYVTLAEADTYLEDSLRGTPWAGIDEDTKARALISAFRLFEKQRWNGVLTGVKLIDEVVIAAGGTGYAVDDILTIAGGTFGQAARILVTAAPGGVIGTVVLIDAGTYASDDLPSTPNSPAGGAGSGASVTLTFKDQEAAHPRTGLVTCGGVAVDENTVALQVEEAQIELAFDLTQDTTLESKSGQGSNIKKVGAGSAEVEFFHPTDRTGDSTRFPPIVHELLRCFLGGSDQSKAGAIATGTCDHSQFDDCDRFDLIDGEAFS